MRLHKGANTFHVLLLINHWLLGGLSTQQNKISIKSNNDVPTHGHSRQQQTLIGSQNRFVPVYYIYAVWCLFLYK